MIAANISVHRGVGEHAELVAVLADVGEEAHEDLQDEVVVDVEQVGHGGGDRVGDEDVGMHPVDRPHAGRDDGMGGFERRVDAA